MELRLSWPATVQPHFAFAMSAKSTKSLFQIPSAFFDNEANVLVVH